MGFPIAYLRGNTNIEKVKLNEYTFIKELGNGRYGVCYLAEDINGELVVIKRLRSINFQGDLRNIKYESTILSDLDDYRIPKIVAVFNEHGVKGYVMNFIKGTTVTEMISNRYKFSKKEIFNIGNKLIDIVKYLHENGIVHRDIRTPNVIINNDEVYLIDFGLARWANGYMYSYETDFNYIGRFLLNLLYSGKESNGYYGYLPWDEELTLTDNQIMFIEDLLGIGEEYQNIYQVKRDFNKVFMA